MLLIPSSLQTFEYFNLFFFFFLFQDLSLAILLGYNYGENSLRFSLSEKVLISHSFPKNILPRYKILGWQFFCFSAWRIFCHFLPSSPVSDFYPLSLKWLFPYRLCIISWCVLLMLFPCLQHSEVWVNPYCLTDFFKFILFSVELLENLNLCFLPNLWNFQPLFLLFQYLNFIKLAC